MPLSKHYIDINNCEISVDYDRIKTVLQSDYPAVVFAYVMGSASKGKIRKNSDLDLAIYVSKELNWEQQISITEAISNFHHDIRCDLGILNNAEAIYRYEALKGKLLYTNNEERWLHFYSMTCREYESQMYHYQKQLEYRLLNNSE